MPFTAVPEVSEQQQLVSHRPSQCIRIGLGDNGWRARGSSRGTFARHYCDDSYRPNVERMASDARQSLGSRVRGFREAAGLTQGALAAAAGIGRVTLVRVEKGEQSPRFETLSAVARALGKGVEELVVEMGEG